MKYFQESLQCVYLYEYWWKFPCKWKGMKAWSCVNWLINMWVLSEVLCCSKSYLGPSPSGKIRDWPVKARLMCLCAMAVLKMYANDTLFRFPCTYYDFWKCTSHVYWGRSPFICTSPIHQLQTLSRFKLLNMLFAGRIWNKSTVINIELSDLVRGKISLYHDAQLAHLNSDFPATISTVEDFVASLAVGREWWLPV